MASPERETAEIKALALALGFELVGIYRRIGYKQGAWRDVGWWQLALGDQTGPPAEPRAPDLQR